jgi:hypothetical protein
MGESPMRYLAQQRLQAAATRLGSSADSIARIAFEVGYESEAAFNRAFKRAFGSPPATWRDARILKRQGGVAAMEGRNIAKARLLYDFIDASDFYENRVDAVCRSRMNVPFFLRDEALNEAFLAHALDAGLVQLKGHKSVGGMRASLYNAMPIEGVQALVAFMRDFAQRKA